LDSLAYQTRDVLDAMVEDCGVPITKLKVDGGASSNNYLMQFQSNLLQCEIERPKIVETTALGAAHLAGLAVGYWKDTNDFGALEGTASKFDPEISKEAADKCYAKWQRAVAATREF